MKQQVASSWSVTKIPGIVNTITENVEVGVGGGKKLDVGDPLHVREARLRAAVGELPAGADREHHRLQRARLRPKGRSTDAVDTFLNPDVDAPEKAATAALGRKPKRDTGPPPSEVVDRGSQRERHRGRGRRRRLPALAAWLQRRERRQCGQLQVLRDEDLLRPELAGLRGGRQAARRPLRRRAGGSGREPGSQLTTMRAGRRRPDVPRRPCRRCRRTRRRSTPRR